MARYPWPPAASPSSVARAAAAFTARTKAAFEALSIAESRSEQAYEAELYRLKGELTLQQWKVKSQQVESEKLKVSKRQAEADSEACFLTAIEIAQKHQAKSLELRATMSLAKLWRQQGKRHEAREKLAAVYNWFTEGFDTKDLQEAKELLGELDS